MTTMGRSGKQQAKNEKVKSAKSRVQKIDSRLRSAGPKALSDPYLDLSNVQPKIDNKPPKIDIDTYYKPQSLEAEAQTVMEIDRQNFELLKKLNTIHRVGGKVDCWKLDWPYKPSLSEKQSEIDIIINENIELLKKIREATSLYCAADLMREWRSRKSAKKDSNNASSKDSRVTGKKAKKKIRLPMEISPSRPIDGSARPRCYFEIVVQKEHRALGKIVFELFADVVPRTCENFQSFCRGFNGLSYKGTPFHRILPGYWCQGGDVTKLNGSGGTSIYGATFADENFKLKHSAPGILSTCSYGNYGKDINDSKFNLTFERLETMDGSKVVFGKVIDGFSTLRELERYGTNNGRPIARIVVSSCGVM